MNDDNDKREFTNLGKSDVTEVNTNGVNENNKNVKEVLTVIDRIKFVFVFLTVEPFLFCYAMANSIMALATQKLQLEKACRADLKFTEMLCDSILSGTYEGNGTEASEAQVIVAQVTAWQHPLASVIPAIVVLFVGAWSDRTGKRKILMLVPLTGEIITSIGLLLTVYFFVEWPLWVTGLIQALPSSLCGGLSIALMGSYSYIADITSIDSRTFRIGLIAIIVTLSIPIATSISGVLTEAVGYYGIFTIGLCLHSLSFIYTYFRIHDAKKNDDENKPEKIAFFHPKHVLDTLTILVKSNGKKRLVQIWLVIWAHIVIIGPVFGESAINYLYATFIYKMDIIEFSLLTTLTVVMGLIGTTIAITIFSKFLKIHDAIIGIIATASKVLFGFMFAFAPTKQWLYAAPVLDTFGNSAVTAIRSLGTKVVDPDEVAKMCSIISLAEALVPVVYTPLYNLVYINTQNGIIYVIGSLMTVPAFFIFIYVYISYRRQERNVVKDPTMKETYAMDNYFTAL